MGLLQEIRERTSSVAQRICASAQRVRQRVKAFLGNAYHAVAFRLDPGFEGSDETDVQMQERCRAAVTDVLGENPLEQFAALTVVRRQSAVLQITELAAKAMGVEIGSVEFRDLGDLAGSYSYTENRISYNTNSMIEGAMSVTESKEAMDTIFHELRHAYQRQAAISPSRHGRDKLTAEVWRLNFRRYVPFHQNPARYFAQPVEQDARIFALSVVNGF